MIISFKTLPRLCAAGTILCAAVCGAEDKDGFYSQGYAGSPLQKKSAPLVDQAETLPSAKKKPSAPAKTEPVKAKSPQTEAPVKTEPIVADEREGKEILAIGALLSTNDRKLFETQLNELLQLVMDKKLKLGQIYAVGNPLDYSQDENIKLRSKLWILDGMMFELDEVPKPYAQVKLAPTWIIKTAEGEILLEAPRKLRDHITGRGRFTEETRSLAHTAEPEVKPVEF